MVIRSKFLMFFSLLTVLSFSNIAHSKILVGLEKLSCETILCLATGSPPHECAPALNFFKSLNAKTWIKTLKKRRKFLDICPDNNNSGLKDVLAAGAFRCDKPNLLDMLNPKYDWDGNITQTSTLPKYCVDYHGHLLTRLGSLPVKMNASGSCYDKVDCHTNNFPWQKKQPIEKVGRSCYRLIKRPGFMQELGGAKCLDLWE